VSIEESPISEGTGWRREERLRLRLEGGRLEGGRLEARSEVKVENVKDKGMRFIASELGLNLSLNLPLGLNLILAAEVEAKQKLLLHAVHPCSCTINLNLSINLPQSRRIFSTVC